LRVAAPAPTVIVEKPVSSGEELAARVLLGGDERQIFFRASVPVDEGRTDPFLTASLIPAMRLGATLRVEGGVSRRLLRTLPTIEDILCAWDGRLAKIEVAAQTVGGPRTRRSGGVAAFFSGGVDSFYTLLKHRSELSALIFVHGFDVKLKQRALRGVISDGVRAAAKEAGLPLIEVETNLRYFSGRYASWERLYAGCALASVALFLSSLFRKVYIPSTRTFAELEPAGSHPMLDPMWSTEATELVHDGCESSRVAKVAAIANDDVAMRWLRVCTVNTDGLYNCGRCEKCLRTMVSLRIAGALDRCSTLPHDLEIRSISRLVVHDPWQRGFLVENLEAARANNGDAALERALRKRLARHERRAPIESYLRRRLRPLYDELPRWAQQRLKGLG
jgi:hypothetical protein